MNRYASMSHAISPVFLKALAALLLMTLVLVFAQQGHAQSSVRPPSNAVVNNTPKTPPDQHISVPNPAADLWKRVRAREPAPLSTQVKGVESAVLISKAGEEFRNYRRETFIGPAGWFLLAVLAGIAAFYIVRGRIKVEEGMSGRRVMRFTEFERSVHWFTAILFLFLALSGLILLFGRWVFLPVFGPQLFGVIASASKEGHNLFGPLFLLSLLLLLVLFARRNLPALQDLGWLIKGGGILGKAHCRADFFNAGEKIWYWIVILVGAVVTASGFVLNFPIFDQGRELSQLALVVHGIAAVIVIAGSFGHIYIGTAGIEGSLDSMTTGTVDANWAKAHHDIWYEKLEAEGAQEQSAEKPADSGGSMPSPDKA